MDKPTKPTDLMPRTFGGVKTNWSSNFQEIGYEPNVPAIYSGGNLNYQLDATGKELDYCEKICDFINDLPIGKTITVDSNNKLVYQTLAQDVPIADLNNVGVVKPDGVTISITNDGTISAMGCTWGNIIGDIDNQIDLSETLNNMANISLSNLNTLGNAKFQYAPFAINNGTVDNNGDNLTLQSVGDVPIPINYYVVPIGLTSDVSEYGTTNKYQMTQTTGNYSKTVTPWTMALNSDYYIPANTTVTFTIATRNYNDNPGGYQQGVDYGCQGCKITYTYTDNSTEVILDEKNTGNFANWNARGDHSGEFTLPVASKEVKGISIDLYSHYISATAARVSAWGISFKATGTISSADTIICLPCTITTADNKTKTFDADNTLDCSSLTDGTYKVMKSYADGSLSIASSLTIQKNAPQNPSNNDLWLDNSMFPLKLKKYNSSNSTWVENNDIVYIGKVTISSGVITEIKNNYFNACPALRYIVESLEQGKRGCNIYSDGYCEQWGYVEKASSSATSETVNLIESYKNTDYNIFAIANKAAFSTHAYAMEVIGTPTVSNFSIGSKTTWQYAYWQTKGFIEV